MHYSPLVPNSCPPPTPAGRTCCPPVPSAPPRRPWRAWSARGTFRCPRNFWHCWRQTPAEIPHRFACTDLASPNIPPDRRCLGCPAGRSRRLHETNTLVTVFWNTSENNSPMTTCLRYESSMVGSYSSTKWFWISWMVSADLPTPPAPTTTSLYSVMVTTRPFEERWNAVPAHRLDAGSLVVDGGWEAGARGKWCPPRLWWCAVVGVGEGGGSRRSRVDGWDGVVNWNVHGLLRCWVGSVGAGLNSVRVWGRGLMRVKFEETLECQ